ncbi:uncharacterized protein LOC107012321 isoform X2 [Solanum pennellii]|uniref:Uncharacterized protein LOC107012321 isoform X2 n=1 Tax=Solanum pennellii TaxID=28526 RepID=A0ABM1G8Y2_SOLPN|nr:uncharacterized protein LOC107012321 isoform X2 [Solanum pennellii]
MMFLFAQPDFGEIWICYCQELVEDLWRLGCIIASSRHIRKKKKKLEHLLSLVKQIPSISTRDAFRPAMEALVADGLLRHSDMDVKVSVASCISEIMRITAPDQPYKDSILKDFFELAVLAFGKLSCLDGHCYSKAVSIIKVMAKYRTGVLMLDLMLDTLIVQMFQHFLNGIRPDHPDKVFTDIKEIMTMIIKESENIPMQFMSILANILINSVKKENQNVSPRSYVLGEEVLQESAVKLHPYLPKAVAALNISFKNYSEVVELTWREAMKCKATVGLVKNKDDFLKALGFASNTKEINFPKACKRQRKQRKRKYFLSQEEGEATDDPTPSTMTMQHNLTPKGVHENKGVRVDVHGYKVKVSSGPILTAIFAKRLKTGDVGSTSINDMRILLSAAARVKLDVTWLQQYLDQISEEGDMEKKLSDLMEVNKTTMLVSIAAEKDVLERNRKVFAAEERLKKG